MSGNLEFYKSNKEYYELIFDYSNYLSAGETIKAYSVKVNDVAVSGTYAERASGYLATSGDYNTIFTFDPEIYDNENIIVKVNSGVLTSGYAVDVTAITNRRNSYTRGINVNIDEYAYPNVYNDFKYNFLIDNSGIYILPAIYDSVSGFMYNTEYTVSIDKTITGTNNISLTSGESFWFTSKYCPMFTSAARVILLLGPEAESFTTDTVNRYIHRTSKEAIDFINLSVPCGSKPRILYNHYGCTPEKVPYNLQRYVECKVAYDLLNLIDRIRKVSGTAGGQTKTLGDMTIKYNGDGSGTSGDNKKDLYDCFTGLQGILSNSPNLCGTGGGLSNAVRGKYDVSKGYPHPTRDTTHNRIQKTHPNANGPWYPNGNTRYPNKNGGF